MSPIIKPLDTITLTIDNRVHPPRVDMKLTSDLSIPFVINIFSTLIANLSAQMAQAIAAGVKPLGNPQALPQVLPQDGGSNDGNQA